VFEASGFAPQIGDQLFALLAPEAQRASPLLDLFAPYSLFVNPHFPYSLFCRGSDVYALSPSGLSNIAYIILA